MIDPATVDEQEQIDRAHAEALAVVRRDDFVALVEQYRVCLTPRAHLTRHDLEQRELRRLLMLHRKPDEPTSEEHFLAQSLTDYGLGFVLKAFSVALDHTVSRV